MFLRKDGVDIETGIPVRKQLETPEDPVIPAEVIVGEPKEEPKVIITISGSMVHLVDNVEVYFKEVKTNEI